MTVQSFTKGSNFDTNGIQTKVITETPFSKEIRILLPKGQVMKDHKSPFPILIFIVDGHIELGVGDKFYLMQTGDIIDLPAGAMHNLVAKENTIVRLTLSKSDKIERVNKVII